jgi:hypothetical protein
MVGEANKDSNDEKVNTDTRKESNIEWVGLGLRLRLSLGLVDTWLLDSSNFSSVDLWAVGLCSHLLCYTLNPLLGLLFSYLFQTYDINVNIKCY